jgi:hypothetical protein
VVEVDGAVSYCVHWKGAGVEPLDSVFKLLLGGKNYKNYCTYIVSFKID